MLSLKNKTVLITRPKEQSAAFIFELKKLGAKAIELPLTQIVPVNQKELLSIHKNAFDWIIFTSYNAVNTFFEVIDPTSIRSKIAVVGEKTNEALRKFNLSANFIPSNYTAYHLATEIPIKKDETIFIPKSNLSKDSSIEILESRACIVQSITTYENSPVDYSSVELNNIFNQKIDFITFASGSAVKAFTRLNIKIGKSEIICIGPETAKVAEQCGISVAAVADPYTVEGMIAAMIALS